MDLSFSFALRGGSVASLQGALSDPSVRAKAPSDRLVISCQGRNTSSAFSSTAALTGLLLVERQRCRKQRHRSSTQLAAVPNNGNKQKILVVGGGLGGFNLALRLSEMPWTSPSENREVILVDPKERFVFLPLLIDYAVSGVIELDEFAPRFDLLIQEASASIEHRRATVTSVDWLRRKATLTSDGADEVLDFDTIVLSTGSFGGGKPRPSLEGLEEALASGNVQRFATLEDAEQLRLRITSRSTSLSSISIIGAGYVGVELASALAEVFPEIASSGNISVFGTAVMSGAESANRQRATERLEALGVRHNVGRVTSVRDGGLSWLPTSESQPSMQEVKDHASDLVIVTGALAAVPPPPGLVPPKPLTDVAQKASADGKAAVDGFLRAAPGIFCLGDASSFDGAAATGQIAMQQAETAAWNIFAQLSSLPRGTWRRFEPSALGEFVALGRSDAAAVVKPGQLPKILPPALPPALARAVAPILSKGNIEGTVDFGGPSAALLRRLAYLYRMPGLRHRLRVAQQWLERASRGGEGASVLPSFGQ